MNWEILSYIFAIALAFSAVVSPIITAKINNKHQLEVNKQNNDSQIELKNLELYFPAKNQAIDNYLECLSRYLNYQSNPNLYNYQVSKAKVSMYVSSSVMDSIDSIDYHLKNNNFSKASEELSFGLSSAMYKENIKKST